MLGIGGNRIYATVLLIDDDLISREVIATILTLNGYTLHTAESGEEAMAMLDRREFQPQVVLVDVQMPGLNGVALVNELRTRSSAAIYAISGSNPPEELKAAVDGFLLKPFSPDSLQKLLDEHNRKPEELTAAEDAPVLSAKILAQFRQMMPEPTVREVYAAVLGDLQKRVAALGDAIARRDAVEVRRIGHTIKGGCGMAGAQQAARLGALLEAESDDLSNSESLRTDLAQTAENLERMLKVEFSA
jgi:CheY-like chemotaxis protein/HPt (histidine-containing phosphotransfer) domain-containing protein